MVTPLIASRAYMGHLLVGFSRQVPVFHGERTKTRTLDPQINSGPIALCATPHSA